MCGSAADFAGRLAGGRCADAAVEKAVRQMAEDWKVGYNSGDSARIAGLYVEDAYYLSQHIAGGWIRGREQIREYFEGGIRAKFRIDAIKVLSVGCSGGFAYSVSTYESTNAGRKDLGVNLVVLRLVQGKWLIAAHESAVPDANGVVVRPRPKGNP